MKIKKLNIDALGLLVIAMVLAGSNAVALKFATDTMEPFVFAGLRALATGIILLFFATNYRLIFSKKILLRLLPGVILILLFISLHAIGVSQSGALKASIYSLTIPVFVYIFSIALLHEPIIRRIFIGGLITLLGSLTMIGIPVIIGQDVIFSDILLLVCYASLAGAIIHGKYMFKWLTPNELLGARFFFSGAILTGYVFITMDTTVFTTGDPGAWAALAYAIIVVGIGANTFLYRGLSRARAEQAAPLMYIDPMTGALLATLLLGETLEMTALIGASIVIVGVIAAFPHHNHLLHHYLHPSPHRLKKFWRRLARRVKPRY